ncbi:MAG: hypothetical protein P8R42_01505 [Candidatus Binatia bacterium]|nr:hypothetical protein [Candidatus Binatia bacterium]
MSASLVSKSGSVLNLNVSTRCGWSPYFFQIRCTVMWPTPTFLASRRALQWVAFFGGFIGAATTACSLLDVICFERPVR